MALLLSVLGALVRALLPALWQVREKAREGIEADSAPARYDAVRGLPRM